jgi:5-methylcytosine-specific restriction endonuclease McrA
VTSSELQQYANDKLTVRDISTLTNVSISTVRYWYAHHSLRPYSPTETHLCGCGESRPSYFYGKNKSVCKTCANKRSGDRVKKQKLRAIEHKGGACVKCGYNASPSALEFHHVIPTEKEYAWDELRKMSWDRVLAELEKCVLVCANCHREIHDSMRET